MRNIFVIIGGGKSQVPFVQAVKNKKFRSIVFDRDVNAPASKLADYFFPISTHDTNSILEKLSNFSEEILSCFTYSSFPDAVKTAASVNEEFNTLGLKLNDLDLVLSKKYFYKKIMDLGFNCPRTLIVNSEKDAQSQLRSFERVILKPAYGTSGSIGVDTSYFRDKEFKKKYAVAERASKDNYVAIQEFLDGEEYSVDGYISDGKPYFLNLARKRTLSKEYGYTIDGFYINDIPETICSQIFQTASAVISGLSLNNTFFNFDLLRVENHLYFIDFGILLDAKIDRLLSFLGIKVYDVPILIIERKGVSSYFSLKRGKKKLMMRFIYQNSFLDYQDIELVNCRPSDSKVYLEFYNLITESEFTKNKCPIQVSDSIGILISQGHLAKKIWDMPFPLRVKELNL